MKQLYVDMFDEWKDVTNGYKIEMNEPLSVFAIYISTNCGYGGDSEVVYSHDGVKFFVVQGSHCSCYGLEGQWSPVEMNSDAIKHVLEYAKFGAMFEHKVAISKWIDEVSK